MPCHSRQKRERAFGAWRLLCLVLCSICWSTSAPAAAPVEVSDSPEVDALVQRGIELRRTGKDEAALGVFQDAARLDPTSMRARVHLAATHQALGHWLEADKYLRQALAEGKDPYVRRHRATLERAAEFVGRRIGSLEVAGEPRGAEVRLNGRAVGTLPFAAPVRAPVGSYTLEVRLEGYYSVSRPVAITSRGILRESVELTKLSDAAQGWDGSGGQAFDADSGAGSPRWLTWTLAGLGGGAAVTSVVALVIREQHASRWNSSECLQAGRSRGEVCPDELERGRDADRVAYLAGGAALVLGAGALVSWALEGPSANSKGRDAASCGLTLAGAACAGTF